MIREINIVDNSRSPIKYLSKLQAFNNGVNLKFNPGVNIIIGKNGSGKSTLMKLLYKFFLIEREMKSRCPHFTEEPALTFPSIFDNIDNKILDGVKVKADYKGSVFRFFPGDEARQKADESFSNFKMAFNSASSSVGESTINNIWSLFDMMFDQTDYNFPINDIIQLRDRSNDVWKDRFNQVLKYYQENSIDISDEDYEFTVLMDEPDRNLDIDNIKEIYDILSYHKPQTQIIAVIHNPILILKLSKLDHINFIELTEGYLESIKYFVDDNVCSE